MSTNSHIPVSANWELHESIIVLRNGFTETERAVKEIHAKILEISWKEKGHKALLEGYEDARDWTSQMSKDSYNILYENGLIDNVQDMSSKVRNILLSSLIHLSHGGVKVVYPVYDGE